VSRSTQAQLASLKKHGRKWIRMFVVILHRFPALPIDSNRSRRNLSKTLRSLRPLRCIFSQWRSQSGRLANIAKVLGHRLRQLTVHMIQQQGLRHQHPNGLSLNKLIVFAPKLL
jgi:hypothetical protein